MHILLSITAISLSLALAALLVWVALKTRANLNERRERQEAADRCIEKFDKEIDAVSKMALEFQKDLHTCFGYISGDGVRSFYQLNEALTRANVAKSRMNLLATTSELDAISEIEQTFTGGELAIQLPRDGRSQESIEQNFTLEEWRKLSNDLLSQTKLIIQEANSARNQFLCDQKNEFKREAERVRFKYPRKNGQREKVIQRKLVRAKFTPKTKKAQTEKQPSSKIVYSQRKIAA